LGWLALRECIRRQPEPDRPVMDPDPRTSFWRDILHEMVDSGEAARHLSPSWFRRAQKLLAAHPVGSDSLCTVVGVVTNRGLSERSAFLGLSWPRNTNHSIREVPKSPIPFTRSASSVEPISRTT
jgi:hypothetical protein